MSPAEILAGFDVDCSCVLYDGALSGVLIYKTLTVRIRYVCLRQSQGHGRPRATGEYSGRVQKVAIL